jgi:hypothetical protein
MVTSRNDHESSGGPYIYRDCMAVSPGVYATIRLIKTRIITSKPEGNHSRKAKLESVDKATFDKAALGSVDQKSDDKRGAILMLKRLGKTRATQE